MFTASFQQQHGSTTSSASHASLSPSCSPPPAICQTARATSQTKQTSSSPHQLVTRLSQRNPQQVHSATTVPIFLHSCRYARGHVTQQPKVSAVSVSYLRYSTAAVEPCRVLFAYNRRFHASPLQSSVLQHSPQGPHACPSMSSPANLVVRRFTEAISPATSCKISHRQAVTDKRPFSRQ